MKQSDYDAYMKLKVDFLQAEAEVQLFIYDRFIKLKRALAVEHKRLYPNVANGQYNLKHTWFLVAWSTCRLDDGGKLIVELVRSSDNREYQFSIKINEFIEADFVEKFVADWVEDETARKTLFRPTEAELLQKFNKIQAELAEVQWEIDKLGRV